MPRPKKIDLGPCPVCSRPRGRSTHNSPMATCGDPACVRERLASSRGKRWTRERKIAMREARRQRRLALRGGAAGDEELELLRGLMVVMRDDIERRARAGDTFCRNYLSRQRAESRATQR